MKYQVSWKALHALLESNTIMRKQARRARHQNDAHRREGVLGSNNAPCKAWLLGIERILAKEHRIENHST